VEKREPVVVFFIEDRRRAFDKGVDAVGLLQCPGSPRLQFAASIELPTPHHGRLSDGLYVRPDPLGLVPAVDLFFEGLNTLQFLLTQPSLLLSNLQLLLVFALLFFSFYPVQLDLGRNLDEPDDEVVETVFETLYFAVRPCFLDIVYPRFDIQGEDSRGIVLVFWTP
jgi:hypothetical protein